MPIVVNFPQPGDWFGPSALIDVQTTTVGPFVNPSWLVTMSNSEETGGRYQQGINVDDPHTEFAFRFMGQDFWPGPLRTIAHGDSALIRVDLRQNLVVSETATVLVKFDQIGTSAYMLQNKLNQIAAVVGATPEINTKLDTIQESVTASFPGVGNFPLSGLLTHPPLGFVTRELIGDFTDAGDLTRPAPGTGVNAFGLTWEIVTFGDGIGVDPGAPERLAVDLLQLELVHTDHDGHEFVSAAADFNYENTYWFFDPALPTRVQFAIAPSVVLRFYWLLATL